MRKVDIEIGKVYKTKSYGDLVVTDVKTSLQVSVRFIDTGYETVTRAWLIKNGSVKDRLKPIVFGVGFIGDGKYKAYINSKTPTKAYRYWHGMLMRCYSDSFHKKMPTYKECTMHEPWHNLQNFAEWFYSNYPSDGKKYDIDKDIKIEGNKHYSPETVLFVTRSENSLHSNIKKQFKSILSHKDHGDVEVLSQADFCREYGLSKGCICNVINGKRNSHKGWKLKQVIK